MGIPLGFKHTEAAKRKIGLAQKGRKNPMLGKHHTEEAKIKMSLAQKGAKNHLFGKHHTEETKRKMSKSHFGKKLSQKHKLSIKLAKIGDKNPNWIGDKIGYEGLHSYLKRNLKNPFYCKECHKNKKVELHNISKKYIRDLSDWEWLCRKCHMEKDGRMFRRNSDGKFKIL